MNQEELLVTFGGEVKALGDGHFGGYLVRFSSADDPDLAGDFFTKNTDFGIEDGQKTPVYFNHRLPLPTKDGGQIIVKQKIGEGTMTIDAKGVLMDAIVWNRDKYEKDIIAAGKKQKLGWSSGTASHLVDSEPAGKARFLKTWQLGFDASLTPIPCEPCNDAIPGKAFGSLKFLSISDDDEPNDDFVKAVWSSAFVNNLPDSSFAFIEDGGTKDRDGRTLPRSLRHLPYRDASGKADAAHVRNALARLPQTNISEEAKKKAMAKLQKAAKEVGVTVADNAGKKYLADGDEDEQLDMHIPGQRVKTALTAKLALLVDDHIDSGHYKDRAQVVKALGIGTGTEISHVERILDGFERPSDAKLKGFARVLDVTYDSLKDAAQRDPARSIKAIFEEALADRQFATWNLWDVYSKVVRKLAVMALNSNATGVTFDWAGKLKEVNDEYIARLNEAVSGQIADYVANGELDEPFYLKSLTLPSADILAELQIDVDQHSQLVESAAAGVVKRFRGMHESRLKVGRTISEKNRARLATIVQKFEEGIAQAKQILDESQPMAAKAEMLAAQSQFLRLQARARQSQQGVAQYVSE